MNTIRSLAGTSDDDIFSSFSEAFADYELQLNRDELKTMLVRRGFVPELSFGAFDNGRLVSFTLNGIGMFNDKKTAYDTGTGTIQEFRSKGLASALFEHSIPFLKMAGVKQYLLEVLQHNSKAVSLYKKLGFSVSREFNYFTGDKDKLHLRPKELSQSIHFGSVELSQIESRKEFLDFTPSWQNSFEAMKRIPEGFMMAGAYLDQELIGFCIIECSSGDITQLAISRKHRRQGIATALLDHTLKHNRSSSVKAINTDVKCDPISSFFLSVGLTLKGKQFEMIKQL